MQQPAGPVASTNGHRHNSGGHQMEAGVVSPSPPSESTPFAQAYSRGSEDAGRDSVLHAQENGYSHGSRYGSGYTSASEQVVEQEEGGGEGASATALQQRQTALHEADVAASQAMQAARLAASILAAVDEYDSGEDQDDEAGVGAGVGGAVLPDVIPGEGDVVETHRTAWQVEHDTWEGSVSRRQAHGGGGVETETEAEAEAGGWAQRCAPRPSVGDGTDAFVSELFRDMPSTGDATIDQAIRDLTSPFEPTQPRSTVESATTAPPSASIASHGHSTSPPLFHRATVLSTSEPLPFVAVHNTMVTQALRLRFHTHAHTHTCTCCVVSCSVLTYSLVVAFGAGLCHVSRPSMFVGRVCCVPRLRHATVTRCDRCWVQLLGLVGWLVGWCGRHQLHAPHSVLYAAGCVPLVCVCVCGEHR